MNVAKNRSPLARLRPKMKGGTVRAVVETPKGTRNKFGFDEDLELFTLSAVLPVGQAFPFDFGLLPKTRGEDGDPLDVLILMDEPAFPGCVIDVRLIGVIEAIQTEDGKKIRNDRLIAVAKESHLHRSIESIKDLDAKLLAEIEGFFELFNDMKGEKFKAIGRFGPKKARALVEKSTKAYSKKK
jgi:inorganic pyrophosphatase